MCVGDWTPARPRWVATSTRRRPHEGSTWGGWQHVLALRGAHKLQGAGTLLLAHPPTPGLQEVLHTDWLEE